MTREKRRLHKPWLLVTLSLALRVGAGAQIAPAPAEVVNRTYRSQCGREKAENLKLRDGESWLVLLMMDSVPVKLFGILGSAEVTLKNDRRKYIAVFGECNSGDRKGYELFLLRRVGRNLVQVGNATASLTGFGKVKFIKQAGAMTVVGLQYGPFGSRPPREEDVYEFRFRFTGTKLVLVDHGRGQN